MTLSHLFHLRKNTSHWLPVLREWPFNTGGGSVAPPLAHIIYTQIQLFS